MTVSLDLQNVKLRQMRSKLFLMSYQQKWVRRFHVCLVLHKKYENYMCKSIVYIQEEGRGVVYTDFFLFFFCTTHNILKNAIFKKRLDERKRKLKNNLYFLLKKKYVIKVYQKSVKNII